MDENTLWSVCVTALPEKTTKFGATPKPSSALMRLVVISL